MATRAPAARGFAGKIAQANDLLEKALIETKSPRFKADDDTLPITKLLKAQARQLKAMSVYCQYQAGRSQNELADELGVTTQRISQMITSTRRLLQGV